MSSFRVTTVQLQQVWRFLLQAAEQFLFFLFFFTFFINNNNTFISIIRSCDYLKEALPKLGVVDKKCNKHFGLHKCIFIFPDFTVFVKYKTKLPFASRFKKYEKGSIDFSFCPHTSVGCSLFTRSYKKASLGFNRSQDKKRFESTGQDHLPPNCESPWGVTG